MKTALMNTALLLSTVLIISPLASEVALAQDGSHVGTTAPSYVVSDAATARDPSSPRPLIVPVQRPVRGLYIRGGLGFGGMGNNIIRTEKDAGGDHPEATVTGMGLANELTIGGAVSSSWVLGGGIWSSVILATDYTPVHGTEIPADLQRPESFSMGGFLADWYFAPQLGVHAQAGLGLAALTSKRFRNGEDDGSRLAWGPGITLALGTEFWGNSVWAMGVMARLTAGATFEKLDGDNYVHGVVTPSLLITICYNE
jgi:hypothetical protein